MNYKTPKTHHSVCDNPTNCARWQFVANHIISLPFIARHVIDKKLVLSLTRLSFPFVRFRLYPLCRLRNALQESYIVTFTLSHWRSPNEKSAYYMSMFSVRSTRTLILCSCSFCSLYRLIFSCLVEASLSRLAASLFDSALLSVYFEMSYKMKTN